MSVKHNVTTLVILFALIFFNSCNKDNNEYWNPDEQKEKDHQLIEEYVENNNLNGEFTQSGLYYVIYDNGNSLKPSFDSYVTAKYNGYYLDGTSLDEGTIENYPLQRLINGWQEGISYIGKQGKIKLIIPSYLAYGHNPSGGIRSDAVLIFDIELLDFYN
jgi:FKBP-type peptidyl-prolyl cis-trans isomerase FkpA